MEGEGRGSATLISPMSIPAEHPGDGLRTWERLPSGQMEKNGNDINVREKIPERYVSRSAVEIDLHV